MKRRLMALLLVLVTLMQTFAFAAQISDFKDFPKNWSTEAMTAAVENGLIIGRAEDRIEPDAILTRAEMTAIITRAFGATTKVDISHVRDVKSSDWFAEPIAKAYKMGVFSGVSPDMFLPNDPIRREDVFLALSRVLLISSEEYSVLDQFTDKAHVDSWAKNAVTGMVAVDYLHGCGNGLLLPRGYITRAELAQVFHNIFKTYISEPGTYNSVAPVGSVIIRAPGVTLKDVTINGDLVLADGIGAGDCNLTNVKVNGRIICRGGEGTVTFTNVTATGKVIINDVNGTVNFHNYRTDIPFHNNLIENTPATFLERTGGGGITSYTYNVYYKFQNINDDNYGTDTADVEQKNLGPVTSGTKVTVATPTFSGFEFDKIVVNNKDQTTNNVTINSKNRNIYVYYTRNEYDVKFYDGVAGGNEIGAEVVRHNGYATAPSNPAAPAGKKFAGWSDVPNGTVSDIKDVATYPITGETKFYPVFVDESVNSYTVVFRNEGVTVKTQQVEYGKYAQAPADPTKDEDAQYTYEFAGWQVDGTVVDVADYEIKKATVFEATYTKTPKVYTVRFLVDGTVYEGNEFTDKKYGDTVDVPAGTPTKPGDKYYTYTFSHWSDAVDGAQFDFSTYTVTGNKDFHAVFTKTPVYYTVTFIADGQEFHKVENIVYEGTSGLPANNPSKANHTFEGWFTKPDGDGEKYLGTEKVTENITVYAHLKALNVKVEFYDEVLIKTVGNLEYGDTVAASEFPAKKADIEGFIKRDTASDLYNNEVHTIPYVWLYQTEDGQWHEFDETVQVKKEVLKVYRRIKRLSAYVDVSDYISGLPEVMVSVAYTEETRAADSIKDALFINENLLIQAYDKSGAEDKAFAKLRQFGFIDDARGINNINKIVKFSTMMGKDRLRSFLEEELDKKLVNDSTNAVSDEIKKMTSEVAAKELLVFVDVMLDNDFDNTREFIFKIVHKVIESGEWHKFDDLINVQVDKALEPGNDAEKAVMRTRIYEAIVECAQREDPVVFRNFISAIYTVIHKTAPDDAVIDHLIANHLYDVIVDDFFAADKATRDETVVEFIDHLDNTPVGGEILEHFVDNVIDDVIAGHHADEEVVELALGYVIDTVKAGDDTHLEDFIELFSKIPNFREVAKASNFTFLKEKLIIVETFVQQIVEEDKFVITPENHFVIENILGVFEPLTFDKLIDTLKNRGVPERALNQLYAIPEIEEIYNRSIPAFVQDVKDAMAATQNTGDTPIWINSGVRLHFNPVSEVYDALYDYAYGKYTSISDPNTDGIKQKIYDYVISNPYYEDILNLMRVENIFNGAPNDYTHEKSGYSFKEFDEEGGYLHLIQNLAVLTDDAVMWYFDDNKVPADLRDKVIEEFANRVVGYMNIFMDLLNNYDANGLPGSLNQIYEDILAYDIASGDFEKVMGKVEDVTGVDARGYFEKLVNHRIAEKGYTKAIDKFGARIEIIVEKLASSRLDREYTDADAKKLVDAINGLFTEDVEEMITLDTVLDKVPGKTSTERILPDNTADTSDNYVTTVDSWKKTVKKIAVELVRELTSLF